VVPLPPHQERKGESQTTVRWVEPLLEGRVAGGYDSGSGCDSDDKSVFPPGHRPAGVDVLEKIFRLPSFPGTVSYEEGTPNVGNGMVANVSYNHTLQREFLWMSTAVWGLLIRRT